jgi:hypothetical protein
MDARKVACLVVGAVLAWLPSSSQASPPDLCEDVVLGPTGEPYTDSQGVTISKWCEPHIDPPVWGGDVCCVVTDEANCIPPDPVGRCSIGMKFTCEYGEQVGEGVACYQPAPWVCELGFCSNEYNHEEPTWSSTSWVCCHTNDGINGYCEYAGETYGGDQPPAGVVCDGILGACNWGQTNEDGTVTCLG